MSSSEVAKKLQELEGQTVIFIDYPGAHRKTGVLSHRYVEHGGLMHFIKTADGENMCFHYMYCEVHIKEGELPIIYNWVFPEPL